MPLVERPAMADLEAAGQRPVLGFRKPVEPGHLVKETTEAQAPLPAKVMALAAAAVLEL
jgi:hypothetical protein